MHSHPDANRQPRGPTPGNGAAELQRKALRPGNGFHDSALAVARAEQALEKLSVNFDAWMAAEVARLNEARNLARAARYPAPELDRLFSVAHDLKGQAGTFGYPFAAEICASLCRLVEAALERSRVPARLVDQHVDAVRAILREGARGDSHPKASVLSAKLREVTGDYLARLSS